MRWLLSLLVLALPLVASAAPDFQGPAGVKNTIARGGELMFEFCNGTCPTGVAQSVADSNFLYVGHCEELTLAFFPDVVSGTAGATVEVEQCFGGTPPGRVPTTRANECFDWDWDTNADGIVDNNILDGVTFMQRGITFEGPTGWLLLDPTVAPAAADVARVLISCK